MSLRAATVDDAEELRAIYNHYVLTTDATFDIVPRTSEEQQHWLTTRSGSYAVIVDVDDKHDQRITGFASLSPYRDRPAYATTVESSIWLHPDYLQRGIGTVLLTRIVETARQHGFHAMIARIVGHNTASIALHQKCGFQSVGIESEVGRKFGKWLDVVVLQQLLIAT